jgi:hypothetical protein
MGLEPTQGDGKRLLSSNRSPWRRPLPIVIPSEAEGSAVLRTIPGNVFSFQPCRWLLLLTSFEQIVETANPKPAITIGLQQNIVAPIRVRLTMVR